MMTDEKKLIADGFIATAKDLASHKAAIARLAENQQAEHAKMMEMAEEIQRLTSWTGLPAKDDPRGRPPGSLWSMAATCRDLILRVWTHLGLPEDEISPPTKGGGNRSN